MTLETIRHRRRSAFAQAELLASQESTAE